MDFIDISWPISSDMTTYKDRNDVTFAYYKTFAPDGVRESRIAASMHTGTHIDAPAHFIEDGYTIERLALDRVNGPTYVADCQGVDVITQEHIDILPPLGNMIVLFKTDNSKLDSRADFSYQFTYVDSYAARALVSMGVKAVGIDYLGIERDQPDHGTHKTVLSEHIAIIEGVRLSSVEPGYYTLTCLPLSVPRAEAAPARAVLSEI